MKNVINLWLLMGAILNIVAVQDARAQTATSAETQDQSLSLGDALDYVDRNYPSVKAALQERVAADRRVDEARTAYLPDVNLLWEINRATVNNITGVMLPQAVIPSVSGPVLPQTGQSDWNSGAGVIASWRIFDFGQRSAKVDAARQAADGALASYDLARLDVANATLNAYLNILVADALTATAQSNVDRLEAFSKSVHVLVDNKLRPGVEGEQADAALALGQTQLIAAQANAAAQRATLTRLLGRPTDTLRLSIPVVRDDASRVLVAGPQARDHPAALVEAARMRQQQAQLSATARSYAPLVDAIASAYSRGSGRTPSGDFTGSSALGLGTNNWAVGLRVTVPLGAYPAAHARQQAQRATLDAERERYDEIVREVKERTDQARIAVTSAAAIARITPTALQAARNAETQQRARFQSGLASVVDVTVAEAALVQAESQQAIADLNVWRAIGAYAAATGDFTPLRTALAR